MDGHLQIDAAVLRLMGPQRLAEGTALAGALRDALAVGGVLVDLSEVTQMDASVAQVLVSGAVSARRLARRLQVNLTSDSQPATQIEQLCLGDVLDVTFGPASGQGTPKDPKESN